MEQQRAIKRPRTAAAAAPVAAAPAPAPESTTSNNISSRSTGGGVGKGILKKNKDHPTSLKEQDGIVAPVPSTATAEGAQMAMALSTFSPLEESRFIAYRRSALPSGAISNFVAMCLVDAEGRRFSQRFGERKILGGSVSTGNVREDATLKRSPFVHDLVSDNNYGNQKRQSLHSSVVSLEEMVAPNSSEEITVVVSTLAKMYAQRLVTAARRLSTAEGYPDDQSLLPRHILEARRHRVKAGIDPGFFIKSSNNLRITGWGGGGGILCGETSMLDNPSSAAAIGTYDRHGLKLVAALAAQDAYDDEQEENSSKDSDH